MDGTYKQYIVPNGIVYPGKATAPTIKSGLNRVQISWLRGTDPKVVKAKIYWNNFTDSVELPVPADQDIITYTIPNLPENYYSFTIKTYDKDGNVSVPVEVSGNAYGERYRSALLNRVLVSSTLNLANNLTVQLEAVATGSTIVRSEIEYTSTTGQIKTLQIEPGTVTVQIPDYKKETSYKLRTLHENLTTIDRFYTLDQVVNTFLLNKTEWRVVAYSSYNSTDTPVGYSAPANMIDGNPGTRWLTLTTLSYPHFITIDLGSERTIKTASMWRWIIPPTTAVPNPTPDERGPDVFMLEGSTDNINWTKLGDNYNFNRLTNNEQIYYIPNAPKARYIRMTAISGPQKFVLLGEFNVSVL